IDEGDGIAALIVNQIDFAVTVEVGSKDGRIEDLRECEAGQRTGRKRGSGGLGDRIESNAAVRLVDIKRDAGAGDVAGLVQNIDEAVVVEVAEHESAAERLSWERACDRRKSRAGVHVDI